MEPVHERGAGALVAQKLLGMSVRLRLFHESDDTNCRAEWRIVLKFLDWLQSRAAVNSDDHDTLEGRLEAIRAHSLLELRRLMQFRLGSHDLPIEQGRMARPIIPRYLRRCTLCSRHAPGDERHCMLECPQFDDIRAQYPDPLQDARDSMRNLLWHQNQKALSDFVIAILDEPRT